MLWPAALLEICMTEFAARLHELKEILDTELFSFGGASISLSKLVIAVLLLIVGYAIAKAISRALERFLLKRLSMEAGAAHALQSLSFYFMLALFILLSLRTVNIPLTAFTVAGGALAIGVGFGSQNIVNNFISGLILLAERPIKIGDLIEIDETQGHVERIGPRSTRVRMLDNTHIIVPNSSFLEKNVLNWTLSDNVIRGSVTVGVAYGSPTREVERLIRRALSDHERVLAQPEPIVLFTEFGDNSLNFQTFFWIRMMETMARRRIQSEIRFSIDDLFREAGIIIAFPQRDVHLDASKPLDVRVIPNKS